MRSRQALEGPVPQLGVGIEQQDELGSRTSRSTRLFAAAKPTFPRRISSTQGNSRATISGVASGLPLSTTVTRRGLRRSVVSNDRRHAAQQIRARRG